MGSYAQEPGRARSTVHGDLDLWEWDGTLERIHHALHVQCRERGVSRSESAWAGRDASPTAAILDSQSVKSTEKGGPASTRLATTAARRSKARSVMSWSTRRAC